MDTESRLEVEGSGNGSGVVNPASQQNPLVDLESERKIRVAETPIRALWNAGVLLIVMLIVGAALAAGLTAARFKPAWTSNAVVRVGRPPAKGVLGNAYTDPAYVERVLRTIQQLTDGSNVASAAAQLAQLPPSEAAHASDLLSVVEVPESELLSYTVHTDRSSESRAFLNAVINRAKARVARIYGDAITLSPPTDTGPTETTMGLARAGLIGGCAALLLGIALVLVREELRKDPRARWVQ